MNDITRKSLDYQGNIFVVTQQEYDDYMIRNIKPKCIIDYYSKAQQATQQTTIGGLEAIARMEAPAIADILTQRGNRYGSFDGHAQITQELKNVLLSNHRYEALDFDMKEAIEMVFHKIGRIVNGDPNYLDSWDDIQGYTKLVSDRLRKTGQGY